MPEPSESAPSAKTFLILGRHGDIINLLPVFYSEAIKAESPINVVVSKECSGVFDGVSYVWPVPLNVDVKLVREAEAIARKAFNKVHVVQVWGNGFPRIQSLAHYNQDAWLLAGYHREFGNAALKPFFNVRSPVREDRLRKTFITEDKPILLIALEGGLSSPFAGAPALTQSIVSAWGKEFQIINLCKIIGRRIYDLLGLMDAASVLVTSDSVHLHLAAASNIPVVALTSGRGGWAETLPRCRNVWTGKYQRAMASMEEINRVIGSFKERPKERGAALIHVTDDHVFDRLEEVRHRKAFTSWISRPELLSHHCVRPYPRNGSSIGGRNLPYLKDLLLYGMEQGAPQDVIVWTNSDSILQPGIEGRILEAIAKTPVTTSRRIDSRTGAKHPGRDLAAFRISWLRSHWSEIPDFLCGTAELDNWMALAARKELGLASSSKQLLLDWYPADIAPGYVVHMNHGSPGWDLPGVRYSDPGNVYNMALLREWCGRNAPNVRFNQQGFIDWSK